MRDLPIKSKVETTARRVRSGRPIGAYGVGTNERTVFVVAVARSGEEDGGRIVCVGKEVPTIVDNKVDSSF